MNEARFRQAEQRLWTSLGTAPSERRVRLAHSGVTVRVQEVGEGPPVLFVHGGSNSGVSWAPLVARLDGFHCFLLDRPGCGLSEPLKATFGDIRDLESFADALIADVLDALDIETADVAATSYGGYLALRGAASHPGRVRKMIEFGWPIGAPIGKTPLSMRLANLPLLGRLMTSIPPSERAVRAMLRNIGLRHALEEGEFTPEAVACFQSLLRDTDTMRNELKAGPKVISPVSGFNRSLLLPEALLASIEAPVYFLWGEDDVYGGAEVARAFVSHFPNAELEIVPRAGHAVWMDDASQAAAVMSGFLAA